MYSRDLEYVNGVREFVSQEFAKNPAITSDKLAKKLAKTKLAGILSTATHIFFVRERLAELRKA